MRKIFILTMILGLANFTHAVSGQTRVDSGKARDAWIGKWKLILEKSKVPDYNPTSHIELIEMTSEGVRFTRDITRSSGAKQHDVAVSRMDGKDSVILGGPDANARAYKRIDSHSYELLDKTDGRVRLMSKIVVSADGKTRTQKFTGTDRKGSPVDITFVFERQ